jgi:NAD-dependent SIR2 family protein deacetylase
MTSSAEGTLEAASEVLAPGRVMLLSGAGLSTDSGIPDYRGPTGSARRGTPMTYEVFAHNASARQRYWARSHLGWKIVADARPNVGHLAVAMLQQAGRLSGIVTQNVDGLHQSAGASAVIELHGNLSNVVCLGCGELTPRRELDTRLRDTNRSWEGATNTPNADGDAVVDDEAVARFEVVPCSGCGGVLKPDVVFFGESVPKERVQRCFALLETSTALLVVGSSLTVMSGFRFVIRAGQMGIPIVIVNQGATRGDELATLRIDAPLGEVLPQLARSCNGRLSRA